MFKKSITEEEIQKLKPLQFKGKIHLITDDSQILEATKILSMHSEIGFDTETKPNFKKNSRKNLVALLQLSTQTDAFLFRLHYLSNFEPIFDILSNPDILKVGVAINGDFKELHKLQNFNPVNFLELQRYIKNFEIENISLKKMAAIVLGGKVSKRQQRSNWEANDLSQSQLLYAATDAWVSLMIYKKLKQIEDSQRTV
jgi:ribonuclease D